MLTVCYWTWWFRNRSFSHEQHGWIFPYVYVKLPFSSWIFPAIKWWFSHEQWWFSHEKGWFSHEQWWFSHEQWWFSHEKWWIFPSFCVTFTRPGNHPSARCWESPKMRWSRCGSWWFWPPLGWENLFGWLYHGEFRWKITMFNGKTMRKPWEMVI